jgi:hypothetical protein
MCLQYRIQLGPRESFSIIGGDAERQIPGRTLPWEGVRIDVVRIGPHPNISITTGPETLIYYCNS